MRSHALRKDIAHTSVCVPYIRSNEQRLVCHRSESLWEG